jgi:hypothetical protein
VLANTGFNMRRLTLPVLMLVTALVLPVSALTAPMSMFSEMFSRCPRNFSHTPASKPRHHTLALVTRFITREHSFDMSRQLPYDEWYRPKGQK